MYYFSIYDKYNYCHSIDNCVLNYYLYISVESAIEILHNLGSCRNTYWERLNCSSCAKWSFYQNHIHFDDGMYIKVGHYTEYDKTKKKFHLLPMLCLEVNPNKHYEKESFKEILSFLKEYCNSGTLIRYDYAIDIPLDISKVKIFNTRKEKGLYKGTFYFGQRNSHGFCKIYDKGKERGLDSSLTRIEHTLVFNKKLSLEKFCVLDSSFVCDYSDLKSLMKCVVAMSYKIRALGGCPDDELQLLDRNTRYKLKEYLYGNYVEYEYDLSILDSLLKKIKELFYIDDVMVDENGFLQYCGDSPFDI